MLSERERRTWEQIEQQLLEDDPRLATSLSGHTAPQRPVGEGGAAVPGEDRWIGAAVLLCISLPLVAVLSRVPAALGMVAAVTVVLGGAVWLWWRSERHRPNGWREP